MHPSKDKRFATTVPNNRPEAEPALQAHLLLDLPACKKMTRLRAITRKRLPSLVCWRGRCRSCLNTDGALHSKASRSILASLAATNIFKSSADSILAASKTKTTQLVATTQIP